MSSFRPMAHRRKGKPDFDWGFFGFVAGVLLLVGGFMIWTALYFGSRTEMTCTVEDKDRSVKVESDSDGNVSTKTDHRVYTDCGIFNVEDNMVLLKFNSSDTYAFLKVGSTYQLDVIGWRNGFFSWYPNILGAEVAR